MIARSIWTTGLMTPLCHPSARECDVSRCGKLGATGVPRPPNTRINVPVDFGGKGLAAALD
jgi:hypothetical protein